MERLLTIDDVADLLQMTPRFVEQQIRMDYLEAIMIGSEWRTKPAALVHYIDVCRTVTPLRTWTSVSEVSHIKSV